MVSQHVRRSTTALARRYARLAATRGLTDDEKRADELVKTFHASLPEVRWKLIIPALLIAVFVVTQVILGVVTDAVGGDAAELGASGQSDEDAVRMLTGSLIQSLSAVPTPGSFIDLYGEVRHARPVQWLALAVTVLAAAYLVLRPLSAAFRIKRIIFNLADTGNVDLDHTTTTWHVPRSAGLYEHERMVFKELDSHAPREIDFDLWISVTPAAVLVWFLLSGNVLEAESAAAFAGLLIFAAGAVGARIAWLIQTAKARHHTVSPLHPPAGFVTTTDNVVEARSVVETSALGLASFWFLWLVPIVLSSGFFFPVVVPSPVWVRLVRERRDIERASRRPKRLPSPRVWPAVGSALLLWVVPPIPIAIHLTRLARLQPPCVGSARRTRAWLVPLSAAATVFVVLDMLNFWTGGLAVVASVTFAATFAAIQHEHNALAVQVGAPRQFDEPEVAAVAALPREAYTSWTRRVLAAIFDAIPIMVLGGLAVVVAVFTDVYICDQAGGWCGQVVSDTGRAAMLIALSLMLVYVIWNWGFRQGRTGSSLGKTALRFEVVSEKTGRPVGFGQSMVRLLAHSIDLLPFPPFCAGYLAPLWDAKRQTFADNVMSTVCRPTGGRGPRLFAEDP